MFTAVPGSPWICSLVLALSVAACGEDEEGRGGDTAPTVDTRDTTSSDTAPSETSDTVPADTSPPGERFAVQFLEAIDGDPVPGVAVTWKPPGGARVEGVADAQGKITLEGIDWSKGALTLFGHAPGRAAQGAIFTKADLEDTDSFYTSEGAFFLVMPPLTPTPTITVVGQAAGMSNPGHYLVVATDHPTMPFSAEAGANFRLALSSAAPFNWSAFEWFANTRDGGRNIDNTVVQWATGSHGGFADDGTMSLDFGTQSMAPKSVTGTFPLFRSETSTLREKGVARVSVYGNHLPSGLVGTVPSSTVDDLATKVDYQVDWIEPEWASEPLTAFDLTTNSEVSRVLVQGWPTAGSQDIALPVPAVWVTPNAGASVDDVLEWVNEEPELYVMLQITFGTQPSSPVGVMLHLPPGTTRAELGDIMGSFDVFAESGESLLGASLVGCALDGEIGARLCSRFSVSKRISLGP